MAITSGQSRARAALAAEQARDAEDWTMEDGPASGWDAIGRVQYNPNPTYAKGVGAKGSSLLNEQLLNQYVSQGPKGIKVGDFMNKVDNGLDTNSLAYGQAIKDDRVKDMQNASNWWDEHPDGAEASWMDKHGFALTATVMAMGAGAAMLAGGGAGGGAAAAGGGGGAGGVGAAGIGSGGAGAGLGAAEIGAGGAGALGAGGAGAAGAIPQVIITGSAGGGAGVGLGTAAGYGAAGAGAAYGLGSMGSGGAGTGSTGGQPTGDQPMQQVEIKGQRPTDLGLDQYANSVGNAGAVGGALSQLPNYNSGTEQSTWDQVKDKLGGMSADDWGKLVNGGLGLVGGNVDRIKANQDADWWKSQIDTLQGMYQPGTAEATQMEQKMEAQDAAAGRRSQYGIRAVNLASNLAEKRAGIMTSAGYQNMANAYRNRSSQDLNGLFAAAGQAGGTNGTNWGSLISGLGSLYSTYAGGSTPSPKPQVAPPPR